MNRKLWALALVSAPIALGSLVALAADDKETPAWRKLRPDAPEMPTGKGDYTWEEPKDWKPPTREELEKIAFTDGPVLDVMEIGRARARAMKPTCSVEEALAFKNDSEEANTKIVAALCQPPASDDVVDWDATMTRHSASPASLSPLFQSSVYESWMLSLTGAGFFGFDHQFNRFADKDVVKRWRQSPLVDVLEIRDDYTWEDGTPVTAWDVEFSFHANRDKRIPIPARSGIEDLKWCKAYDDRTVAFFFNEPSPTNKWNIGFSIVPKHVFSKSLADDPTMKASEWHNYWNRNPLSGNAYTLKEWNTGQYLVYERRESHYLHGGKQVRPKPYFKRVRFQVIDDNNAALLAMKKGELDDMILVAAQWTRQTDDEDFYKHATKVRGPQWLYGYIGWNQRPIPDKPYFKDARVRKALALAFDHEEFLKKLCFGLYQPCIGPFHPDSPWGTPDVKPIKQNLDEAENLLDEAGWKLKDGVREKDGVKFEFTLSVPTGGTGAQIAELLKQNLDDIGIKMNIKMLEWATFQTQNLEHRFDASIAAWGTGADPDSAKNIWTSEMYEKGGRNYVGYGNKRVDELFELGQKELDHEKRRKIYQEINRLIYQDQPYLFLNYRATLWAFSKEMRGYNFSPRDPFSYSPGFSSMWKPKKTK